MRRAASDDYWALDVALAEGADVAAEAVSNFLWEIGAIGVVEEGRAGSTGLRAFFPPGTDAGPLAGRLREYLADLLALGATGLPGDVVVERLPAEPWADAWREHFRPLPVGRRLCVSPPWERPGPEVTAGRAVVWIEPGRAFGTGGHATTRGCLELLERALDRHPVERALDVGTGSGVLAIAAVRLGVDRVLAIDPDPDAVAAAAENAVRNEVGERVAVTVEAIETWRGSPVPLVLANLLGTAHVAFAGALAEACAAGGQLIAGGILVHEVPAVVGAFAARGLWLIELIEHEGWATLRLGRARTG